MPSDDDGDDDEAAAIADTLLANSALVASADLASSSVLASVVASASSVLASLSVLPDASFSDDGADAFESAADAQKSTSCDRRNLSASFHLPQGDEIWSSNSESEFSITLDQLSTV